MNIRGRIMDKISLYFTFSYIIVIVATIIFYQYEVLNSIKDKKTQYIKLNRKFPVLTKQISYICLVLSPVILVLQFIIINGHIKLYILLLWVLLLLSAFSIGIYQKKSSRYYKDCLKGFFGIWLYIIFVIIIFITD